MLIVMQRAASLEQINRIIADVEQRGLHAHLLRGQERTIIGVVGEAQPGLEQTFTGLPGVEEVAPISKAYKLTSREFIAQDTRIPLNGATIGGSALFIIAGPCSVEGRTQLLETAHAVREAGAHALRGGAFKPRTSPYSFQGLGEAGLGDAGGGTRGHRPACGDGGDGPGAGPARRPLRRYAPDRRAQHAELRPAPRRRREPAPSPAQARADGDRR